MFGITIQNFKEWVRSKNLKEKSSTDLPLNSHFIRFGTDYGGWYIPKDLILKSDDICYFIGAGEDISFDCAIAMQFPCQIHIFDPTPKSVLHYNGFVEAILSDKPFFINNTSEKYILTKPALDRMHYHPWGISGKDGIQKFFFPRESNHVSCSIVNLQRTNEFFEAYCYRISSVMEILGHEKVKMIKIDIEGSEYDVIQDIVYNEKLPEILLIEFDEIHTPIDSDYTNRIKRHVDLLESVAMHLVYVNESNYHFIKTEQKEPDKDENNK